MQFKISQTERNKRKKNNLLGTFFAAIMVIFIIYHSKQYPSQYNDVLFWSILGFIIFANLIGFYRYRRYLIKIKEHWLEVTEGKIIFNTNGEITELDVNNISALNFYYSSDILIHIQIKLSNNHGIRLEGYDQLQQMADLISNQVPAAHISGKK